MSQKWQSQTGPDFHKETMTLWKHSCKTEAIQAALHMILVQLQACQYSQTSDRPQHDRLSTSREFTLHNLSSCEVSIWFRRPKDNQSKLSCQKTQKVLSVQSYKCDSPLRSRTTDQTGRHSNWSRPSWVNKERQSLKYVLYNNHI